jgi:small subunit ribosomal protein S17
MRGKRKVVWGKVTSDKMDKTVSILVETRIAHPLYGKSYKLRTRLKAHDEKNEARSGDIVEIMETRPLSKTKRWRLVRVVDKAARV